MAVFRTTFRIDAPSDVVWAVLSDFVLDPAGDGAVDVTHVEEVTGALLPVFRLLMGSAVQRHHDGLNAAPKSGPSSCGSKAAH